MHELMGVKALIEHYHAHEHHDEDSHDSHSHDDISFLEFLNMHYANDDHKNAAGHENLPFHHDHPNTVVAYFFASFPNITFEAPQYFMVVKPKFLFEQRFDSNFFYSIWQPPKC
jgi:hypothetical protein